LDDDDDKNGGRNDDDKNGGQTNCNSEDDGGNSKVCFATLCLSEKQACDESAECTRDFQEADREDRDGPPSTVGKSAEFGKLVTSYLTLCNDDDDETTKCMIASCASERNACFAGSSKATCSAEFATSMVAGNRPYAKGKSMAFGALLTCMHTNCGLPIMTEDVCAAVAVVAKNTKLQDLFESEGVDVECL
jgi:hypothetical protein